MRIAAKAFDILAAVACFYGASPRLYGQGTVFTYQGRLNSGSAPVNGSFDFAFILCDSNAAGNVVAGPATNAGVSVTAGLFTATIDFGTNAFSGQERWLQVAVRTNGNGPFSTLSPRQPLTPAPYSIYAGNVNAAGITGTIPPTSIGPGAITAAMLSSSAAAANLGAGNAIISSANPAATNLTAAGYIRLGGPVDLRWLQRATDGSPGARDFHRAVWTGNKMIIWGGGENSGGVFGTGAAYDPLADLWTPVATTNAPQARTFHTAVWTGTEMIVWGGAGVDNTGHTYFLNTGARYNPTTDTWTPTATNAAPSGRQSHSAVWTGTEMIVWGGRNYGGSGVNVYDVYLNDGARYNPATDIWTPLPTNGAPDVRILHSAVWTGSQMLVWGGESISGIPPTLNYVFNNYSDGARYNPATDSWSPISANGAPTPRYGHACVWTGDKMLVWGGSSNWWDGASFPSTYFNDGASYNPASDSWAALSVSNSPAARSQARTASLPAVWTGSEMIIWGGTGATATFGDGGRYSPASDSWAPIATTGAPVPRLGHSLAWTGSEMVVFGGVNQLTVNPIITYGDTFAYSASRLMYLYLKQ